MNDVAQLHTESCSLCGEALEYLERASTVACSLCGRSESGHVRCPDGHYVCDVCHGQKVSVMIRSRLCVTDETVPTAIAEELLAVPELPMLGCEHALIAGGALMASLRNRVQQVTQAHVDEVLARTERQAVGAYCGLTGVCGVVPALAACYSVLAGGLCGKGPETRAAMELVSELAAVTAQEADPGCCKAYVRSAIVTTEGFLQDRLGIPATDPVTVVCHHTDRHPHGCRGDLCAYHPERASLQAPGADDSATTRTRGKEDVNQPVSGDDARPATAPRAQQCYDEFFELAYSEGALDRRTKILVSLGASLGSGCAP